MTLREIGSFYALHGRTAYYRKINEVRAELGEEPYNEMDALN